MHVLAATVVDGNRDVVRRTIASCKQHNEILATEPSRTLFDLLPGAGVSDIEQVAEHAPHEDLNNWTRRHLFEPAYETARLEREHAADVSEKFLNASFTAMIAATEQQLMATEDERDRGMQGAEGRHRKLEIARAELDERRHRRILEAQRGRHVHRGDVTLLGSALVLPELVDPESNEPTSDKNRDEKTRDAEIERTAIRISTEHETAQGYSVKSVEREPVSFDLLSQRDGDRRCIEVKGRAGYGSVELTWSEYAKALELGREHWLYVVLDCGTENPRLFRINDPARNLAGLIAPHLDVRFRVDPDTVLDKANQDNQPHSTEDPA